MKHLLCRLILCLWATVAFGQDDRCDTKTYKVGPKLQQQYDAAVKATRYPTLEHIVKDLTPIIPGVSGIFNEQGQVLMVTWSKCSYFKDYEQGQAFKLYGDTWFSPAPQMQEFCSGVKSAELRLRVAQRLGMPPNANNNVFVQLWVWPKDIFRPCPDPEIYDTQCVVRIPFQVDNPKDAPWRDPDPEQQAEAFMNVSDAHLDWNRNWWDGAHGNCSGNNCYPWTALGYTWDWDPDNSSHVGGSEYVVLGGTQVVFESMDYTDEYCGRN